MEAAQDMQDFYNFSLYFNEMRCKTPPERHFGTGQTGAVQLIWTLLLCSLIEAAVSGLVSFYLFPNWTQTRSLISAFFAVQMCPYLHPASPFNNYNIKIQAE